jgi:hypothetical protein
MQNNIQYVHPYNPHVQQNPIIATAPPLDDFSTNTYQPPPNYPLSHPSHVNHMYIQQPHPLHLYSDTPYNVHHMNPVEQYNREMEIRKKQQEDDCFCLGLLVICCCCLN